MSCIDCGVEFGLTDELYAQRVADGKNFVCPNGHRQRFTGPSAEQKRIHALERERNLLSERFLRASDELEQWKQALRHCPICRERVSQARSIEVAAHRLNVHLQQTHQARGAVLALMPASS
jgi:hypothetical protein